MPSDWNVCNGTGDASGEPCCYVNGELCPHLQINGPSGRKYACGLFVKYGNWDLVHGSAEYNITPKPTWKEKGVVDCGFWWGPNVGTAVKLKASGVDKTTMPAHAHCCFKREVMAGGKRTNTAVTAANNLLSKMPVT